MLLNCGVEEDSWESLGLQGDPEIILKEISPEYSLEGLMVKLKFQDFDHLMQRANLLEKTLMLGKIEGRRRRGRQEMVELASPTQWTWVWMDSGSWWWTGRPGVLRFMGSQRVGHDWVTELNPITSLWMNFVVRWEGKAMPGQTHVGGVFGQWPPQPFAIYSTCFSS